MDLKDLILVVGGTVFVAILAHGIWIAWRRRREAVRLDIRPQDDVAPDAEDEFLFRSELPNGGARLTAESDAPAEPADLRSAQRGSESIRAKRSSDTETEDAEQPNLAQGAKDNRGEEAASLSQLERDPSTADLFPELIDNDKAKALAENPLVTQKRRGSGDAMQSRGRVGVSADRKRQRFGADKVTAEDSDLARTEVLTEADATAPARSREPEPDELIILGVMAAQGEMFGGADLVEALRGQGLKFGDMSIFHRIDSATGVSLFSVANAREPGVFDLADLDALETPGLTFFMQLPVPGEAIETLDDMLLSARAVAAVLGGEVKDDTMSALTGQTVEHMRQRIADFARAQLTKRADR